MKPWTTLLLLKICLHVIPNTNKEATNNDTNKTNTFYNAHAKLIINLLNLDYKQY